MKLKSDGEIFSWFDTNGRRKDVLNSYKINLKILNDIGISPVNPWKGYPKSLNEYEFYKQAIKESAAVLKEHPQYDAFKEYLKNNPLFEKKFYKQDPALNLEKIIYTGKDGKEYTIKKILDNGIEARARHYTTSLNKMGFITSKRELTPSGKALIDPSVITTDILERNLNLSLENLIVLRQIFKARVFGSEGKNYYSPGKFALYIVLKDYNDKSIYNVSNFMKIVQLVSPTGNYTIDDIDNQLTKHGLNGALSLLLSDGNTTEISSIQNIGNNRIPKDVFYKIFINRKSQSTIDIYFHFYNSLCDFILDRNENNYNEIKNIFSQKQNKDFLKKAFGYGKNIFKLTSKTKLDKFILDNQDHQLLTCSSIKELNAAFYVCFVGSKKADNINEKKSETKYVLEATGLFKTESGIVTVRNKDLFENKEIISNIKKDILNQGNFEDYEQKVTSPFGKNSSLIEILDITEETVKQQLRFVINRYGLDESTSLEKYLNKKKSQEFEDFVHKRFPRKKVFEILSMFKDRDNDSDIQKEVTDAASIPTIFEYISGLAWYYLSDEHYCLMKSFRLTFDANFLPLTHASGGDGDIIINYNEMILMIEVTLMNKNAQKRGEWEPVLRHSVNLSIESDKPAITLFLANELDNNTINIWRAVGSVPLTSSNKADGFTDTTVKIMPLQIDDFIEFSQKTNFDSKKLFNAINNSYEPLSKRNFDKQWRDKIIESTIK